MVCVNADAGAALKLLTNGWFHLEDKIEHESSKNLSLYSYHKVTASHSAFFGCGLDSASV